MKLRPIFTYLCAITFVSVTQALEFRVLSWSGPIDDLKYTNNGQVVDLVAWDSVLSPRYQHSSSSPLVLFREIQQEGKKHREAVATVSPPEGFTHAILMLAAADSAKTTYSVIWLNDSPNVRKAQTITYQNFSSYPVAIKLGKEAISLAPQEAVTRPTDPAFDRLPLKIAAQTPTGWETVAGTSQPIRPGLRTLVILRDGRAKTEEGDTDLIDLLAFNDLPPPEPTTVASR